MQTPNPFKKADLAGALSPPGGRFSVLLFIEQQKQGAGQATNLPAPERHNIMRKQYTERIQLFPTSSPYIFRVGLILDMQSRLIGKLDKAGEGTFISTNRSEKHLFKKTNALGVNHELLQRFEFRWVMVPYCGRQLWTSKLYLLHHGKVFSFGKAGFETQIFLPLDDWGIEKAKAFEKELGRQGTLFGEAA